LGGFSQHNTDRVMMGDLLILVVARVGATSRWHLADGGGVVDGIAEVVLCFAK
jgi:hypothetical protein